MSAASPKVQDKASEKAQEPSMEEILASIRRIIADDQAPRPSDGAAPAPDDVLDLADIERVGAAAPAPRAQTLHAAPLDLDPIDFGAADEAPNRSPDEPPHGPASTPAARPEAVAAGPVAGEPAGPAPAPAKPLRADDTVQERLTSATTDASVNQAFNLLAHTVLTNNARTLDDLVKDMLRPMLKAWLDDNLPVVVERLVRAEIERVSRGR